LSFSFFANDTTGPVVIEIRGLGIDGQIVSGTFILNKK
jgi:hypothetical protein